jgi:hypothetical protein
VREREREREKERGRRTAPAAETENIEIQMKKCMEKPNKHGIERQIGTAGSNRGSRIHILFHSR